LHKIKLAYGQQGEKLVHVNNVANGLKCECVCPGCGSQLIARNKPNSKMRAHFAHYKSQECDSGIESALHKMAIQLIADIKTIVVPEYRKKPEISNLNKELYEGQEILYPSKRENFDRVEKEYDRKGYRVDATGFENDNMLHIEIKVTHKVDEEKSKLVASRDEYMIEVDLGSLDPDILMDEDAFKHAVIEDIDNRHWIHHPEGDLRYKQATADLKEQVDKDNYTIKQQRMREQDLRSRQLLEEKEELERQENTQQSFQNNQEKTRNKYRVELDLLQQSQTPEWLSSLNNSLNTKLTEFEKTHPDKYNTIRTYPHLTSPIPKDWALNTHRIIWQIELYKAFIEEKPIGTRVAAHNVVKWLEDTYGVLPFVDVLSKERSHWKKTGRQRNTWYGDVGCWYLTESENRAIPNLYAIVLKFLNHLKHIHLLKQDSENDFIFIVHINSLKEQVRQEQETILRYQRLEEEKKHMEAESAEVKEARKQDLRDHKKARIIQLVASERRIYETNKGDGRQCQDCYFSSLEKDGHACPFCGSNQLTHFNVSESYLKTAANRYRTSIKTRKSLDCLEEIPTDLLSNWMKPK